MESNFINEDRFGVIVSLICTIFVGGALYIANVPHLINVLVLFFILILLKYYVSYMWNMYNYKNTYSYYKKNILPQPK